MWRKIGAYEIFRSLETLFRETRFLIEGNSIEELRVIDDLKFSVAKLMRIEGQWEAMVLEGDILEKSYSNIGNSGSSKLYSLLPALLECKHNFRSRYKNVLDDMEKCLLQMVHFHAHLKDRLNVLDELIREITKIEPAIDPSYFKQKKTTVQYWVASTSKFRKFSKEMDPTLVEISNLDACFCFEVKIDRADQPVCRICAHVVVGNRMPINVFCGTINIKTIIKSSRTAQKSWNILHHLDTKLRRLYIFEFRTVICMNVWLVKGQKAKPVQIYHVHSMDKISGSKRLFSS